MMHILQIAPPWLDIPPKGYGGTESVISILTERLITLGHTVTLFATGRSKTSGHLEYAFDQGLYHKQTPWEAALAPLVHFHRAYKLALEKRFDVVHAHLSSQTDLAVLPFLSSLAAQRIPVMATLHSPFPLDVWSHMDSRYIAEYGAHVPIINISRAMEQATPDGLRSIGVVYNSIPLEQYQYAPEGGKDLVWFGKILPQKGLHEVIKLAKVTGRRLLFAGVVDQQSKISREYFETEIKQHIDNKQIVYVGEADVAMKNKLLAGAEVFVNPIQWDEPFGLVMAESQAVGTPVLAYNRGAAPEVVKHNETGFVVNSFDEMIRALKEVPRLKRQAARTHVEQNFTPEHMLNGYVAMYHNAIRATKLIGPEIVKTIGNNVNNTLKAPFTKLLPDLN